MSTNTPAHSRETRTPCTHCFDVTSRRGQTWRCHGALLVISTSLIRVSCPRDFVTLVGHVEEASWNVMAHAQKPDFVFRRKGRVHLNRLGGVGRQFSRLLAAEVCASAVVMLDTTCSEVVWRVLATHSIRQFPLHFPSRASPCAITFQLQSNGPGGCCAVRKREA